jgi:hypothetical protein
MLFNMTASPSFCDIPKNRLELLIFQHVEYKRGLPLAFGAETISAPGLFCLAAVFTDINHLRLLLNGISSVSASMVSDGYQVFLPRDQTIIFLWHHQDKTDNMAIPKEYIDVE